MIRSSLRGFLLLKYFIHVPVALRAKGNTAVEESRVGS